MKGVRVRKKKRKRSTTKKKKTLSLLTSHTFRLRNAPHALPCSAATSAAAALASTQLTKAYPRLHRTTGGAAAAEGVEVEEEAENRVEVEDADDGDGGAGGGGKLPASLLPPPPIPPPLFRKSIGR